MTYGIHASGEVAVTGTYTPGTRPLPMIPRMGTELVVSPGLEKMEWHGRGPGETYIDRQFQPVGTYRSTVTDEFVDYSRPQENGNKTDVSWMTLTNADGYGVRFEQGDPDHRLSVGASHHTKADLEAADYSFQLPRRAETYVNIDLKQMGVGGVNSWSALAWPLEKYRIPAEQPYTVSYVIRPVGPR
ncbi:MAG: hypothetical protein R2752_07255 [Vicinamibacterales bacterium]